MYIVEMFNGSSNTMEIMGLDSDGELYVKKVIQHGPPTPDYREFRCSGFNWPKILDVGRRYGWVPAGAVLENTINKPVPDRSDYEPPSWGEVLKIFTAEDASNLADALERALERMDQAAAKKSFADGPILLKDGMTEHEYKQINDAEYLPDLIAFLRKGKFTFVWDD